MEVLVIGGGPTGCVTAMAHARRGHRVTVVEASTKSQKRFAGELLHPIAVRQLREVGLADALSGEHLANRGFALFGREWSGARILRYPEGRMGATIEFPEFVGKMRDIVGKHHGIEWLGGVRVEEVQGQRVKLRRKGETWWVRADRIIGADGKLGRSRTWAGKTANEPEKLSWMAGVTVTGVNLPYEGFGHVFLSPHGPALAYRIGTDTIRLCLDVPTPWKKLPDRFEKIAAVYAEVLPPGLREAVVAELLAGRVQWAVNSMCPRDNYGRQGFALIGDSVGHVHPMTAAGMSLGFGDATALARHEYVANYASERREATRVSELLATALYEIFALNVPSTAALRAGVESIWARGPQLRGLTLDYLSCEENDVRGFLQLGARMVAGAGIKLAWETARERRVMPTISAGGDMLALVRWLLEGTAAVRMHRPTPLAPLRRRIVEAA